MKLKKYYFCTEQLCVGYQGKVVVSDVEIGIQKGEILSLIGPNGAGKSTILKSIIKQLEPIGGVAFLDGRSLREISSSELAQKMSVVLTDRIQTELMTVEEVVSTGRYPYTGKFGVLGKDDWQIVHQVMELTHVMDLKELDFMKMSDGQKQRVMLARALAQKPEILILDEPTSFLDIKYKMEFLSILQNLSKKKKLTVIMSLHEVELAERISDYIACICDGKMDRFGSPKEILTGDYLKQLYHIDLEQLSPTFQELIRSGYKL